MLCHLERRALRGGLGRLGQGRGDTQLCRIKGQGATAYREGQRNQARARNKGNQTVSRESKGARRLDRRAPKLLRLTCLREHSTRNAPQSRKR